MVVETSSKPVFYRKPVSWTRRQIKLKSQDVLHLLGVRTVDRLSFSSFVGGDYAYVVDVGAADGSPDLYKRFPDADLEIVEPHPLYQSVLERSILRSRKARLHKCAAGSEKGEASLYLKGRTGSSLLSDRGRGSVDVSVERLDALIKATDIKRPSLLKIDTEGYELDVLKGAEGILDKIDCVVAEVYFPSPQYTAAELIEFLRVRGFQITQILDHYVWDNRFRCADIVFERIPQIHSTK
jgi:FkbM family methyltransferase